MKNLMPYLLLIVIFGCSVNSTPIENRPLESFSGEWGDYWYAGKAELTSFKLEQARYGEIHDGTAVLVFVTEDFSKSKLVKLDNPKQAGDDAVKVMKLNFMKNFNTGIYPYSMMQSTFTPVDRNKYPNTLKLTTSSQEWCGHTFTQLNLAQNNYQVQGFSYFESEGDQTKSLDKVLTEDEIMNLIRIDPKLLPEGEIEIIPSLFFQRLRHKDFDTQTVTAKLTKGSNSNLYSLNYSDHERSITIEFNKKFPYDIIGWEESYKSGFGAGAKTLTTKATKMKSLVTDYWNKHDVSDAKYRDELNL